MFFFHRLYVLYYHSLTTMLWYITNKAELYYYSSLCKYLVCLLWWPADSSECRFGYHCRRWASDCCNLQRGSRNKIISHLLYNFILNPSMAASSNPFRRGSRGWGMFIHGNHDARGGNGSSWWGCLCDVCFVSKKSSEREFFVPARTHLDVKIF
jgi:hypothetical protein